MSTLCARCPGCCRLPAFDGAVPPLAVDSFDALCVCPLLRVADCPPGSCAALFEFPAFTRICIGGGPAAVPFLGLIAPFVGDFAFNTMGGGPASVGRERFFPSVRVGTVDGAFAAVAAEGDGASRLVGDRAICSAAPSSRTAPSAGGVLWCFILCFDVTLSSTLLVAMSLDSVAKLNGVSPSWE